MIRAVGCAAFALAVGCQAERGPIAEAVDRVDAALAPEVTRLLERATAPLTDERDAAVVVDLATGFLAFEHHPGALWKERYVPGSTMKLFTAYALLADGVAEHTFNCRGSHVVDGVERPCWNREGHGPMRLRTALAMSCNAWFYGASAQLSQRTLQESFSKFGFGDGFGSRVVAARDIVPAVIPRADLPDVAVGDNVALRVAPGSLLRATTRIALQGRDLAFHHDPSRGKTISDAGLSPPWLREVAEGMHEAVVSGTLAGVFASHDLAAKTGTAKKFQATGTQGFVLGYLPFSKPRFAFVVVKRNGQGAKDAGPVAASIAQVLRSTLK